MMKILFTSFFLCTGTIGSVMADPDQSTSEQKQRLREIVGQERLTEIQEGLPRAINIASQQQQALQMILRLQQIEGEQQQLQRIAISVIALAMLVYLDLIVSYASGNTPVLFNEIRLIPKQIRLILYILLIPINHFFN